MGRKILITLNLVALISLIIVNLVGVLLPELGFDALWYHLPLSKLFLTKGQWYFPGGLYYYSPMPRLAELIALPLFAQIGYHGPKLIQFLASLLTTLLLFKISKKLTSDSLLALTAANLYYATWLVSWQSSSGYVDLVRTVFEFAALYTLLAAPKVTLRRKIVVGIFLGLAIGVKWHALGSLALFSLIFSPLVLIPALLTAFPWFYLAYHFTGNPVYPLLTKFMSQTQLAQVPANFYTPSSILARLLGSPIHLTLPLDDFISPVTGLIFLLCLLGLFSSHKLIRQTALYAILGTFFFLLTPPPSARYFLPFLPPLILVAVYLISRLKDKINFWFVVLFTLSAFIVLGLRLYALTKFTPLVLGRVNQNQFLASLSYRLPETFIDADNYVVTNLPPKARYLITNLHNLYYFPYDFDHDSFANPAKEYDYLVTKGANPPAVTGELIHTNSLGIQIFKL